MHLRGLIDGTANKQDAWSFHAVKPSSTTDNPRAVTLRTHYAVVMSSLRDVCVTLV
jgi:hypothetical protein